MNKNKQFCIIVKYNLPMDEISDYAHRVAFSENSICAGEYFKLITQDEDQDFYYAEEYDGGYTPWIAISDERQMFDVAKYATVIRKDMVQLLLVNEGNPLIDAPFSWVVSKDRHIESEDGKLPACLIQLH